MNLNMQASANALANNGLLALLAGANAGAGTLGASGGLGNSGLEALMQRALAARAGATPANGTAVASNLGAELETRMRTLTGGIENLSKRMDEELLPTLGAIKRLHEELDQIRQRLDKLEKERGKNASP
jgi:hypothetical protein